MKSIAVLLGVLGGVVVGLLIGRYVIPIPPGEHAGQSDLSAGASSRDAVRAAAVESSSTAATTQSVARLSPHERIRTLLAITSLTRQAYEAELFFAQLSAGEMPAIFDLLQELPPGRKRSGLISLLFARWGELDGPAALAAAGGMPARERWPAEARAFEGWAKVNPRAAWEAARTAITENPMVGYRGLGPLRELARTDLAGAMQEVEKMALGQGRFMCRWSVIEAAVEIGTLDAVLQHALQVGSPEDRVAWVKALFQRWGSVDTDAPMSALRAIADPDLARSAMDGFMSGWSELDAKGAIGFALDHASDALVAQSMASTIGSVQMLGEAEIRDIIAMARAKNGFDFIAPKLAAHIGFNHPVLAMELAAGISDEQERARSINSVLPAWANSDFASAAQFYEGPPDTPAKVEAFRGISWSALEHADGPANLARWLSAFQGADRVQAAEKLMETLARSQDFGRSSLKPEDAATLSRAIADTPNLPPDLLERSRKLLPPPPP